MELGVELELDNFEIINTIILTEIIDKQKPKLFLKNRDLYLCQS